MPVEPIFTYPQILIGIIILFAAIRIVADIIENHIESDEESAKLSPSQRALVRIKLIEALIVATGIITLISCALAWFAKLYGLLY